MSKPFTRELVQRVNSRIVKREPLDLSGLPAAVAQSVASMQFDAAQVEKSLSKALQDVKKGIY